MYDGKLKAFTMAYTNGGENNSDAVPQVIRDRTGVQYARTITCTGGFTPQENLLRFYPTVFHMYMDEMFAQGEKLLAMEPETLQFSVSGVTVMNWIRRIPGVDMKSSAE